MTHRYKRLLQLLTLFYDLQKQYPVRHDYKKVLEERLSSPRYIELTDLMIRQITILLRMYRTKEKGVYLSEKEDLVIAVNLMHGELKSETMMSPLTGLALHQLERVFGYDRMFMRKDVMRVTGYKESQSQRIIKRLLDCEKLKRVGGYKNRGYFYQLVK